MVGNAPSPGQSARRKAFLVADQLVEAGNGTPPEISNGVPAARAALARPAVRYGLLLTVATLAVLARRKSKRR
ncbi:hypothetical protein [Streptomyces sp. NPDC051000]|uniref:hypothetical protein n=1 Tax=unclassified Streptomyces TaxID=2593676 RepID=UPI00340F6C9E